VTCPMVSDNLSLVNLCFDFFLLLTFPSDVQAQRHHPASKVTQSRSPLLPGKRMCLGIIRLLSGPECPGQP
jgi:hypothetical protein